MQEAFTLILIISQIQFIGDKLMLKHIGGSMCPLFKQQYRYQLKDKLVIPSDFCAKKRIATVLKSF